MKLIILYASVFLASGLLLTNIYTSIVDAQSWGSDIPNSINTARNYYKHFSPGNFFRIFSPFNQLLALSSLIVFWKRGKAIRTYLILAFICCIAADVFTFSYFYPRNDIMFGTTTPLTEVERLTTVWKQWSLMNWYRSLIVFTGLIFSSIALHKIHQGKQAVSFLKSGEIARTKLETIQ